jgi:mitochondrial fission protein ELM1
VSEPLVIWRLTDGKPGHMQQTLGLVQAMAARSACNVIDIDLTHERVGLLDLVLGRFPQGLARHRPDFIIGAGHGTHTALLAARRAAGGRAVALMKPSLPLSLFDMVIAPAHDGLAAGPRVINTIGVLNPMHPAEKKPDSLLLLFGGPSKHVVWDDAAVLQQVEAVLAAMKPGTNWRLTDSRRTPETLRSVLRERFGERFQAFADCPPGWLAERLAVTDTVWVTSDSVSMVYEALTAGCRVGLLELPEAAGESRVMRGMQALVEAQRVTAFAQWSLNREMVPAAQLDEAGRVADLLLASVSGPVRTGGEE